MSVKSQEKNMRRLAEMLGRDLSYIWGEKESGPNGDKKVFLNTGKTFLRALAKDLELREANVTSNAGGIAVSGECTLNGMWEDNGIHISLGHIVSNRETVILFRSIRDMRDHTGGRNMFLMRCDLEELSYNQMLEKFSVLRKEAVSYERAA